MWQVYERDAAAAAAAAAKKHTGDETYTRHGDAACAACAAAAAAAVGIPSAFSIVRPEPVGYDSCASEYLNGARGIVDYKENENNVILVNQARSGPRGGQEDTRGA